MRAIIFAFVSALLLTSCQTQDSRQHRIDGSSPAKELSYRIAATTFQPGDTTFTVQRYYRYDDTWSDVDPGDYYKYRDCPLLGLPPFKRHKYALALMMFAMKMDSLIEARRSQLRTIYRDSI